MELNYNCKCTSAEILIYSGTFFLSPVNVSFNVEAVEFFEIPVKMFSMHLIYSTCFVMMRHNLVSQQILKVVFILFAFSC